MKHIILFCLFLLVCTSAYSQIADTQFGESNGSVLKKLQNRFGYPDDNDDAHIIYWDKSYANHDWDYITFDFKTDVDGNTHLNYNALTKDFITIESAKNFLFGLKSNLSYNFNQAKKETDVLYSYTADENSSTIDLYIYFNRGEAKKYTVWLTYQADTIDYKLQDLTSSVMYTHFGDSYDKTMSILESKYGFPDDQSRDNILYKDVNFAGLKWDAAFFTFDYTTSTSHLTGIMLTKGYYSSEEAKNGREKILRNLIHPKEWQYKNDDNGFKQYLIYNGDRNYLISIAKKLIGYPYAVNVIIKTNLYQNEDKL